MNIKKKNNRYFTELKKNLATWVSRHYINLAIFNALIVILVLLHSAKYFDPFWTITVNVVVFVSLIASVVLLGAGSKAMFLISLLFLLSAGFMKAVEISVWAERITVYMFESFLLGFLLLFIESFTAYNDPSRKKVHGKN